MADQFQSYDQSSGMVSTSGGREFPAAALDPAQLSSMPTTSHVQAAPVTLSSPAHPGATDRANKLLGGLQLVQQTIQSGAPAGTVDKAMAPVAAAEDAYAAQVTGDANAMADKRQASIAEQQQTAEQARQQAEEEQAMHRQRAEIARLNQGAIAAQEDPDLDPRRLVDSMSTGTKILTVILGALGGAAGAVTGTENGAMKALNKAIDDDIMAQQQAIADGKARRGNLVQYFQQQGMDEASAADAARGVALANADRLVQLEAQELDNEGARTAASQLGAQLKAQREARNAELKLKIETSQASKTYQRPQPAGGGSASDVLKEILAGRDIASLGKSGLTHDEQAKLDAEKRAEQNKPATEDQSKAAAAAAGLVNFFQKAGLQQRDGAWHAVDDGKTFNARQRERAGDVIGTGSKDIHFALKAAVESFGRTQSGGVIGDEEGKNFEEMINGAKTDKQLEQAANAIMTIVIPRLRKLDQAPAKAAGSIPFERVR